MAEEISRRTIIVGAAWALPVVTLAVATPAAAASAGTLTLEYAYLDPFFGGQISVGVDPTPGPPLSVGYFTFNDPTFSVQGGNNFYYWDAPDNTRFQMVFESSTGADQVQVTVTLPGYAPLVIPVTSGL